MWEGFSVNRGNMISILIASGSSWSSTALSIAFIPHSTFLHLRCSVLLFLSFILKQLPLFSLCLCLCLCFLLFFWLPLFSHFLFPREEDNLFCLFLTNDSNFLPFSVTTIWRDINLDLNCTSWIRLWTFTEAAVFSPSPHRRHCVKRTRVLSWETCRLTLPRQLCNYGVQAWDRNWAKNKHCVFIRAVRLRSDSEVNKERRGKKFVDKRIFTSQGSFFILCNCEYRKKSTRTKLNKEGTF